MDWFLYDIGLRRERVKTSFFALTSVASLRRLLVYYRSLLYYGKLLNR